MPINFVLSVSFDQVFGLKPVVAIGGPRLEAAGCAGAFLTETCFWVWWA